jgi:hypothetical protein
VILLNLVFWVLINKDAGGWSLTWASSEIIIENYFVAFAAGTFDDVHRVVVLMVSKLFNEHAMHSNPDIFVG